MEKLILRSVEQACGAGCAALLLESPDLRRILRLGLEPSDLPLVCRALHRDGCGRDSVFGLLQHMLRGAGATGVGVWLELADDGRLEASVRCGLAGETVCAPCRPVEAVLLAARLGAPIFAGARLVHEVDRRGPPAADRAMSGDVHAWLRRVRPGDFRNGAATSCLTRWRRWG